MPEHRERAGVLLGDDHEGAPLPEGGHQVLDLAIDRHGDRGLEEARPDGRHDLTWHCPRRDLADRAIGKRQLEAAGRVSGGGVHRGTTSSSAGTVPPSRA
jgi:hypothetical protein